jgi:hypothetical protein
MGLFDIFSKNDDQAKIDAFASVRDIDNFVDLGSVSSGMRQDNSITTLGDVVLMPIETDEGSEWGSFANNCRPQYLNQLFKQVPLHSRIIKNITDELTKGYYFERPKNDVNADLGLKEFQNKTCKKSSDFDTFQDFLERFIKDFIVHGNLYFKVYKSNGVVKSYEHIPSERVRILADKNTFERKGYAVNNDWLHSSRYQRYDCFDPMALNGWSVICFQNALPDYKVYGEPDYISSLAWLELAANISDLHKQNIINGVYPTAVMTFFEYPKDPEGLAAFKNRLKALSGRKKKGKILTLLGKNPDVAPKIERLQTNNLDKEFLRAQEDIGREICYAWGVDPATMGMRTPGSLGNSQEIEFQTEKFEERLKTYKYDVLKIINKLIKLSGFDMLNFVYEVEETSVEAENLNEKAQAQLRGSVGGVTSLLQVQQAVQDGVTNRDQAIAILEIVYGFTPQQADKIV